MVKKHHLNYVLSIHRIGVYIDIYHVRVYIGIYVYMYKSIYRSNLEFSQSILC